MSSLLPGAALLAAALGWWVLSSSPPAEVGSPEPTKAPAQTDPTQPVTPVAGQVAPSAGAASNASKAKLLYPDGSTAELLNGVTEPVKLVWNSGPFTPIKDKILDQGIEWYVHEDGTRSTVRMIAINGVPAPIGLVAKPTEALPTSEDIERQLREQAAVGK